VLSLSVNTGDTYIFLILMLL